MNCYTADCDENAVWLEKLIGNEKNEGLHDERSRYTVDKMTARLFGNMAFGIVYSMNFPKWVKKSVNMTDRLLGKSRLVAW